MKEGHISFNDFANVNMLAVENEDIFKNFKNIPEYTAILEHVSYQQGLMYKNEILKCNSFLLDEENIQKFKQNDFIGSPKTYDFGVGNISPTILRYVKVLSDLITLFGSLDECDIVEIGGGNGGQGSIINKYFNIKSYTFIDLPEVMLLQRKCSRHYGIHTARFGNTLNEYDLVISNYAFSECGDEYKQHYIDDVLLKSKRGYLTMNSESDVPYKNYLLTRLSDKNPIVLDEVPLTAHDNYIIVWGNK